jgi:capsule biosynthesis phosphatase
MIYCFDLDDTICFPNHEYKDAERKYRLAKPNNQIIDRLNSLFEEGHKIIIHTARRMLTFNGDIDKIKADVEKVTIDWLKEYKVSYSEIFWGKPYADYYIDDKAINVKDF